MKGLHERLLATFRGEHRDHLERIRSILGRVESGGGIAREELDEAFRRAHSLKGAARAVDLKPVEMLAHRLETLFARVREDTLRLEAPVLDAIHRVLDATEDCVSTDHGGPLPGRAHKALAAIETVLGMEVRSSLVPAEEADAAAGGSTPSTAPAPETVRVGAGSLDRLLRSAGLLVTESLHGEDLQAELAGLQREVLEIQWEHERLRRAYPPGRMDSSPELAPVKRYLDAAQRRQKVVAKQLRGLRVAQGRNAWALRNLGGQLVEDVRQARLVSVSGAFEGFPRMVRDLARDQGKEVDFHAEGLSMAADRVVLQALKDPSMHLLRNAVIHGVEPPKERQQRGKPRAGSITLRAAAQGGRFSMVVEDDGCGIDLEAVRGEAVRRGVLDREEAERQAPEQLRRLIFRPGLSTARGVTELSGRGMGLSVVEKAVASLRGEVEVRSREGGGTVVRLTVPVSLSTGLVVFVASGVRTYALPAWAVDQLRRLPLEHVDTVEGRPVARLDGRRLPLVGLAQLLGLESSITRPAGRSLQAMVLKLAGQEIAVAVDAFVDARDVVIRQLGACVPLSRKIAGGVLMPNGSVCLVLDPVALIETAGRMGKVPFIESAKTEIKPESATVLVVDDSMTTRTLEKSILEARGYKVRIAVDGMDGLAQLRSGRVDLVITDLQMPNLDGFALLEEMKRDERLAKIPTILVTSLEDPRDKERGLAIGADAYIVKKRFDQRELLETMEQLL